MKRLGDLIAWLLPRYVEEGKTALVVAVGCTGGHHRSVALAQYLCDYLVNQGRRAGVNHRDIRKQ